MGGWNDPENGQQQKVVEGIPASYYGTFPHGQPSSGVYPPPPQGQPSTGVYPPPRQGGGYGQPQEEQQPLQQQHQQQQEPHQSYASSTYPAVPQSQGGFSNYRPWGSGTGGGAWGGGGGGVWGGGGAWGTGGQQQQQQQYSYQYGQQGGQLPFCNLGYGWLLFLLGFLFVIPWYIGALMLCCVRGDPRERAGYIACCVASVILLLFSGSGMGYHQHRHHRW